MRSLREELEREDARPLPIPTFPIGTSLTKGLTFSSFKTPMFARRIQRSVSGRELVTQDYANPIWQFKLTFNFLRDFPVLDAAGNPLDSELRNLMEFYNTIQIFGDTFFYLDRDDWQAENIALGLGDGSNLNFQLRRDLFGGYPEYVTAPWNVNEVTIDDVATEAYTVNYDTGVITFESAPPDGATIRATFTFFFRCRFIDDSQEFERFAHQLWSVREMRFRSVLL